MLSRPLDQSETLARLTTRPGGGACAQLLREEAERRGERPQSWRPGGGHALACVCVSVCDAAGDACACAGAPGQWLTDLKQKSESQLWLQLKKGERGQSRLGERPPGPWLASQPHQAGTVSSFRPLEFRESPSPEAWTHWRSFLGTVMPGAN